ncbi:unnamed protein product [Peronospora belbahrii]|uniref:Uncharacterized protein n=1 Tax=Peronospora belbahrii TaxID=622444 RepID=A0AAU9L5T8_9STRA|nr:unnamed protein product [Peronospora belbahrii]
MGLYQLCRKRGRNNTGNVPIYASSFLYPFVASLQILTGKIAIIYFSQVEKNQKMDEIFDRNRSNLRFPQSKRVCHGPSILLLNDVSTVAMPPSLQKPPLPPLKDFTGSKPPLVSPGPCTALNNSSHKFAELRSKYLDDITMVIQELKAVLTYGPGSACPDSPVPPSVVLKLVRTVQTLEKLRALLLMNPARLRRVSCAQMETVEQQIRMNLLPIATLFRSFDHERQSDKHQQDAVPAIQDSAVKMEQDWSQQCDTNSPCSPSEVSATPMPQYDWRFLSMALSLQL